MYGLCSHEKKTGRKRWDPSRQLEACQRNEESSFREATTEVRAACHCKDTWNCVSESGPIATSNTNRILLLRRKCSGQGEGNHRLSAVAAIWSTGFFTGLSPLAHTDVGCFTVACSPACACAGLFSFQFSIQFNVFINLAVHCCGFRGANWCLLSSHESCTHGCSQPWKCLKRHPFSPPMLEAEAATAL